MENPSHGRTGRYASLLGVLVALLLGLPALAEAGYGFVATALGYPALFLACGFALGDRASRRVPFAASAVVIFGEALLLTWQAPAVVIVLRALAASFLLGVVVVLLGRILNERRVTLDTILGGICVYLLIGVLCSALYGIVEFVSPGSFTSGGRSLSEIGSALPGRDPGLLYYSFVTLTTLGYGDIAPALAFSRMLSVAEAVTGQLYLAILIASLVGMHLARRTDEE
jgi:hypothetical protein